MDMEEEEIQANNLENIFNKIIAEKFSSLKRLGHPGTGGFL
jgi:hypothetical protein